MPHYKDQKYYEGLEDAMERILERAVELNVVSIRRMAERALGKPLFECDCVDGKNGMFECDHEDAPETETL